MSVGTKAWCGIDFGTSNSAVGLSTVSGNRLAAVENAHVTIPTAIFFNFEERTVQYGRDAAAEYIGRTQGRYMRGLKSLLGSSLIEEQVALGYETLTYAGIIGKFLGYLKDCMEREVDAPVEDIVIGRPVHFVDNDPVADGRAQDQLEFAARDQGFRNIVFQLEPIAAALDYEQTINREEVVLVVDMGGGTSDVSVIRLSPDRKATLEREDDILSSQGVHIGGSDFDKSLSLSKVMPQLGYHTLTRHRRLELPKWCFVDLATWHRIQSLSDPKVFLELRKIRHEAEMRHLFDRLLWIVNNRLGHRLAGEVEAAKVALTNAAEINFDFAVESGHISARISQYDLAEILADSATRIERTVSLAIRAAGLTPDSIDTVFFTGGSSLIPSLRSRIIALIPESKVVDGDMFGSVALGLALEARRRLR